MAKDQQISIKARIIKLQKEEELANRRINEAQRRKHFISDMNQFKTSMIRTKYFFNRSL